MFTPRIIVAGGLLGTMAWRWNHCSRPNIIVFDLDATLAEVVGANVFVTGTPRWPIHTAPHKNGNPRLVYARPFALTLVPLLSQVADVHISTRGTNDYAHCVLNAMYGPERKEQVFKTIVAREHQTDDTVKKLETFVKSNADIAVLVDDNASNFGDSSPGIICYHISQYQASKMFDWQLLRFVLWWLWGSSK